MSNKHHSPLTLQGIKWKAMNTTWTIYAPWSSTEIETGKPAWQDIIHHQVERFEHSLSRFRSTSEVSKMNELQLGCQMVVSELFHAILVDSLLMNQQTDGWFSPFLGKQIKRVGYTQSIEQVKAADPATRAINRSFQMPTISQSDSCSQEPLSFVSANPPKWQKNAEVDLDFGGIGKGWMADRIAKQLRTVWNVPCGLVDAGGDLTVWGISESQPFIIDIQDPWDEDKVIADTTLVAGALATSNRVYRKWQNADGSWMHHLLDPHTGLPSTSPTVQATVHAECAMLADVWAKCLCMLPPEDAFEWISKQKGAFAAWIVTEDGNLQTWSTTKAR